MDPVAEANVNLVNNKVSQILTPEQKNVWDQKALERANFLESPDCAQQTAAAAQAIGFSPEDIARSQQGLAEMNALTQEEKAKIMSATMGLIAAAKIELRSEGIEPTDLQVAERMKQKMLAGGPLLNVQASANQVKS